MARRAIVISAYLLLLMQAVAIRRQLDLDEVAIEEDGTVETQQDTDSEVEDIAEWSPSDAGMTTLKIKLKKPEGWSLAETGQKTRNIRKLTTKEKAHWWAIENAEYLKQPAVAQVWQETNQVWDFNDDDSIKGKVDDMLSHEVPGVYPAMLKKKNPTFLEVFTILLKHQCPMWVIGGTVRDLLSGREPNDVDCSALCHSDRIRLIAKKYGWVHGGGPGQQYFSIGEVHGENKEYLEGFSVDLVFNNPFTPESTVNMMMYSLTNDFVIDPSGYGRADAAYSVLRAGSPPVELTSEKSRWGVWRQWTLNSFAMPPMQRHVRYLKMRGRGWVPANNPFRGNKCFQFFMANQLLLAMLYIDNYEGVENLQTVTRLLGFADTDVHPGAEASLLWHFAEQLEEGNPQEENGKIRGMMEKLKEDIESYFDYLPRARSHKDNVEGKDPSKPYGCDASAKFLGEEIDKTPRSSTHPYQKFINSFPLDKRENMEKVYAGDTTAGNGWRRTYNAGLLYMCKHPSTTLIKLAEMLKIEMNLDLREACKAMQRSYIAITFSKEGAEGVWSESVIENEIHPFSSPKPQVIVRGNTNPLLQPQVLNPQLMRPVSGQPFPLRPMFIPEMAMPQVVNIMPERRQVLAPVALPRAHVWNGRWTPGWI